MLLKVTTSLILGNFMLTSYSAANEHEQLSTSAKVGYGSTQNQFPSRRLSQTIMPIQRQIDTNRNDAEKCLENKTFYFANQKEAKQKEINRLEFELNKFNNNQVYSPILAKLAQDKNKAEEELRNITISYELAKASLPPK